MSPRISLLLVSCTLTGCAAVIGADFDGKKARPDSLPDAGGAGGSGGMSSTGGDGASGATAGGSGGAAGGSGAGGGGAGTTSGGVGGSGATGGAGGAAGGAGGIAGAGGAGGTAGAGGAGGTAGAGGATGGTGGTAAAGGTAGSGGSAGAGGSAGTGGSSGCDADAGPGVLVLNEARGQDGDFVELYNAGTGCFDLSGYGVTDEDGTTGNPRLDVAFRFPSGLMLGPGEYIVIEAGQVVAGGPYTGCLGGLVASCYFGTFGISKDGEMLFVLSPTNAIVDQTTYPVLATGRSWGRLPDGTGAFAANAPTPGAQNSAP